MLKKSSLISFIWCYSLFYCFCRFWVIHSLNHFPLLVRVWVSILSLATERYKSKDISIMTRAINKWTTSHESSRRACFHHINIFFLEVIFGLQKSKGTFDRVYHCFKQNYYHIARTRAISAYGLISYMSIRTYMAFRKLMRIFFVRSTYCMDEKSDHVFRGLAFPPP